MLKYLIVKELKQIFRSGFLPKLIFIMPIVMIGVLPFVANQEIKGLKVSIVDSDHTTISEKLVNKILSGKYFALQDRYASFNEAMKAVENGSSDVVIEIPAEFEKKLLREGSSKVNIKINGVNGMKASLGSNYLTSIINDYALELKEYYRSSQGNTTGEVFSIKPYYLFNPKLDYKVFMVPAIMVMLLTLMCGFLPALNIVGEKEKGTLEQINVTPVTRLAFILSKLIPYWLIGLVIFTLSMLLSIWFYGLVPKGSLLTIYGFALLYILVISGLGLVVSNYAQTMQQSMFIIFFFMLIFILMSGLFTPIASMPNWAQIITIFSPLKYFIEVMRSVYLKGSTLLSLMPQMFALGIFAIVLNFWAIISYKKSA